MPRLWFGFGYRGFGQIGLGEDLSLDLPEPVQLQRTDPGRTQISKVIPSWSYTAFLTEGGDIYCWGWNESGQLGLPSKTLAQERGNAGDALPTEGQVAEANEFITIQAFPALIDLPDELEAAKISCGSRHTAVVTRAGDLYTWGWGKYGQLGHGDTRSLDQPKLVEYFPQKQLCVNDVICRHWNTYVLCL
ncbi:hypothetical protein FKM82_004825 [Ascaphus truei]